MKLYRLSLTHKLGLMVAGVLLFVGIVFFFLPHTHANPDVTANIAAIQSSGLLLDSSFDGHNATVESMKLSADASQAVSDFGNSKFGNYTKWLHLSPDRKLVAVTLNSIEDESDLYTYIASADGSQITPSHLGAFSAWAPDSSKILLYLSPMGAPWVRRIYALDAQNKYYDIGLPNGTINADISPIDGGILYSLTSGGTDDSTLYVRDPQGNDKALLKGNGNILTWVRWSPKADKISFLMSDLLINKEQSVWVMNSDGTGREKLSDVVWGYPAMWSPDGTNIAFANAGNIWEYDATSKSLKNTTNFTHGQAQHPSYSADGKTIVFSSDVSGKNQIWSTQDGTVAQLTNDSSEKDYPILP